MKLEEWLDFARLLDLGFSDVPEPGRNGTCGAVRQSCPRTRVGYRALGEDLAEPPQAARRHLTAGRFRGRCWPGQSASRVLLGKG